MLKAPLFISLAISTTLFFCELDRDNPFDETGYRYQPPEMEIDRTQTTVKNNDTINIDSVRLVLKGNKPQCRFQVKTNENDWSELQQDGVFVVRNFNDGKHTIYINTMYDGGTIDYYDTINFFVKTAGYKPAFSTSTDTTIYSDTGKTIRFTVHATGEAPILYSWFRDATGIPDMSKDTFTISKLSIRDTAVYFCVASNKYGKDISRTFTIRYQRQAGAIEGTVIAAADSKKLSDASISLSPGAATTTTDTNGMFTIAGIGSGTYTLKITSSGYHDSTISGITIDDTETVDLGTIGLAIDFATIVSRIVYNGNENDSGSVPMDSGNHKPGDSVVICGNTGKLSRTGYTFTGWNTEANGSGSAFNADDTFLIGTSDIMLYAKWYKLPVFLLTYNGNNNTAGNTPVDSSYFAGQTVTVAGNPGDLEKTGFSFAGWNMKDDGTGDNYTAGSTLKMPEGPITLYSKWSTKPTYSITYNGNNNTSGDVPSKVSCTTGTVVTIAGSGSLIKTGFMFIEWNTVSDGSGKVYRIGDTLIKDTVNSTLYSQWEEKIYTIAYYKNGSTGGTAPPSSNHLYGAQVTIASPGNLVKTGYAFYSWNTDSMGSGIDYSPGDQLTIGTKDVNLYARWEANIYVVTFNTAGGNAITDQSVKHGDTISISVLPLKTSYTFAGWFKESACENAWNFTTDTITSPVTLYAKWIIMDADGNVYTEVTIGTQTWMVENLKTTKFNDGTVISPVTDAGEWKNLTTPGYCWYENDSVDNKSIYGALYNWYSVNTDKLAPEGWHVPTDIEWDTLITYLNKATTDENNFHIVAGGSRDYNGEYNSINLYGYWWSSASNSNVNAQYYYYYIHNNSINYQNGEKRNGFSVRCIRDW